MNVEAIHELPVHITRRLLHTLMILILKISCLKLIKSADLSFKVL